MKRRATYLFAVVWISCGLVVACGDGGQEAVPADDNAHAVPADDNTHLAMARTATEACQDATDLFNSLCLDQRMAIPGMDPSAPRPAPGTPRPNPEYAEYHRDPVKIFDNLYFIGSARESSWAIETSEGLIILDTMSAYAAETEIWDGLKELGFDPAKDVKIILLSHGHGDHYGGTSFLQENIPGVQVYLTEPDWDLIEASTSTRHPKPTRDQIVTDKMKLTLGDTTLELHLIPGHTPGNTSALIPLKDGDQEHLAMYWGGTALQQDTVEYFRTYAGSVANFRTIAVEAGADVILGGHPHRDGSNSKIPALAERQPGDPHPYVIGNDGVNKVLTVISECAAYKGDLAEAKALEAAE